VPGGSVLKRIIIVLSIFILALSSYFIINSVNSEKKTNTQNSKSQPESPSSKPSDISVNTMDQPFIINSEADYLKAYRTFEEFIQDSKYIIKAKVLDTKVSTSETMLFTIAHVKVQKSYLGEMIKDEIIELVFNEATLEGDAAKEYLRTVYVNKFGELPDTEIPNQIMYSIDGQENFKVGDSLLLFLIDKPENVYGISIYNVVGAAQGRFLWKGNKIENHHLLSQQHVENLQSDDKSSLDADKVEKHLKKLLK
jgi:hypothetical protein